MADISVIIPTKNGARYLDETLERVFAQRINAKFEVIIIDSGSRDETLEIAARHPVRLHTIAPEQFNHGGTRNLGARIAEGKLLVFLTQDATPANDQWLHHLTEPFARMDRLAACGSRQLPRPDCNPIVAGRLENLLPVGADREVVKYRPQKKDLLPDPTRIIFLSNVSACYRASLLRQYPFETTDFGEDAQWELKILARGYATMFQPKSMVYHSHNLPLREQLRSSFDATRTIKNTMMLSARFNSKRYQPLRKNFYATLQTHAAYLKRKNYPLTQRWYWLSYALCWYSAKGIGALLGMFAEKLPRPLQQWLSRQKRLISQRQDRV